MLLWLSHSHYAKFTIRKLELYRVVTSVGKIMHFKLLYDAQFLLWTQVLSLLKLGFFSKSACFIKNRRSDTEGMWTQ